jgi:hypothetical protein
MMHYVALLFAMFAVIVSIVALILEIRDRTLLRRVAEWSSSSAAGRHLRRERKVFAFGFSVGPVGDGGLFVSATGGAALGVGASNGPFAIVGPVTAPLDAINQNAITITRCGTLRNLYVSIGAVLSDDSVSSGVARVSLYTAACGSSAFSETSLIVRKTDVGTEPTISCLSDLVDTIQVGAGDRVAVFVRAEGTATILVSTLSAGFELHH